MKQSHQNHKEAGLKDTLVMAFTMEDEFDWEFGTSKPTLVNLLNFAFWPLRMATSPSVVDARSILGTARRRVR